MELPSIVKTQQGLCFIQRCSAAVQPGLPHQADFYEALMPSVDFCLFAHPIQRSLSIYLSAPPHANKPKSPPIHPDRGEIGWKPGDRSFRKAACELYPLSRAQEILVAPIFRQLCVSLIMTISGFFTKTVYSLFAPLVFLIFVTNKRFSVWTTLDDFRKDRIS